MIRELKIDLNEYLMLTEFRDGVVNKAQAFECSFECGRHKTVFIIDKPLEKIAQRNVDLYRKVERLREENSKFVKLEQMSLIQLIKWKFGKIEL